MSARLTLAPQEFSTLSLALSTTRRRFVRLTFALRAAKLAAMGNDDQIDAFYTVLGERVRRARKQINMSQADLAVRLGLSRTSIANLEAGRQRPAAHQVAMIAEVLDIPVHELLPSLPSAVESVDPVEAQHANLRERARSWASAAS
jgi:transcriptional regulator with XRE-family HTH domain